MRRRAGGAGRETERDGRMAIVEELEALREQTIAQIAQAADTAALEQVRIGVLGKAGTLTGYLRQMGQIAKEERAAVGKTANEVRAAVEGALAARKEELAASELAAAIGKEPVEVNEAPGFVVNKILIPYCNEGVCVLQEGVASAEDIDIAMQLGCNHPMGPLHLGDLIGWDVVLNIMDVLFNETHDSKYRANVLIRKMVRAGKLGIKSGEGFFKYTK